MEPIFRLPHFTMERVVKALSETYDWSLQFLGIPEAWKLAKGAGVTVAILDTGCDLNHPDLQGAIADYARFAPSGFPDVEDRVGHGTWCAGMIGARANGVGVCGVAPDCKLLIGKVLGDDGSGSEQSIAAGVSWAMSKGADIISLSLGGPMMSNSTRAKFQSFVRQPEHFAFGAAGNDGNKTDVDFPAKWPELICVGAVDKAGNPTDFSNGGPRVDIWAPGYQMLSTIPGGYGRMSGTSMATPEAAAIGALALSKHRAHGGNSDLQTTEQMRDHLKKTAKHGVIGPADLLNAIDVSPAVPPVVPGVPGIDPNAGFTKLIDVPLGSSVLRLLLKNP